MKKIALIAMAGLLASCTPSNTRDYESSAACRDRGYQAGTEAFEDCVKEASTERMMRQQREEYERWKAEEEYWKSRRRTY